MEILRYLFVFAAACLLMPAALRLSLVLGAVDVPDGGRKQHASPTPRLGGLCLFLPFFVAACLSPTLVDARVAALLSGGTVLFAAGLCDDVTPLPAPFKLVLQSASAVGALLTLDLPQTRGVFSASATPSAYLTLALYTVFTVAMINAVNFIDGLDAEAASVTAVGFLTLAGLLGGRADTGGVTLCLLLVTVLLAFLLYNRPPAAVFMGDEGSQFLGLAAAVLLLPHEGAALPVGAVLLFAVPLFDLTLTVLRRLLHGSSPLRADRSHVHHRLLRRGFSAPATVGLLTLFAVCAALIGYGLCA